MQMTHLPMANASALVVATTSLVLGFTNTLHNTHLLAQTATSPQDVVYGLT